MFCSKCGAKLEDNITWKFCEKCGAPIEYEEVNKAVPYNPVARPVNKQINHVNDNSVPKRPIALSKGTRIGIVVAAIVLAVAVALGVFLASRPTVVNVDKYYKVAFDGVSPFVTASYDFDDEQFVKDYKGKIKATDALNNLNGGHVNLADIPQMLEDDCISDSIVKDTALSNGDEVVLNIKCDDELAKRLYNVKFNYSKELKYEVKDMPEYITKVADVDNELLDKLDSHSLNVLKNEVFSEKEGMSLESSECVGKYVFFNETSDYNYDTNGVILVYRNKIKLVEDAGTTTVEAIWCNTYKYIIREADGTYSYDEGNYSPTYNQFEVKQLDDDWFSSYWYVPGYDSYDEFYSDNISLLDDSCLVDSDISSDGIKLASALIEENRNSKEEDDSDDGDSDVDDEEYSNNEDYIISYSDEYLLDKSDIKGLTVQELNYAKNEIYARHGRIFDSEELQNYFNSKDWYYPEYTPDEFAKIENKELSSVEKKNANFLADQEKKKAKNGIGYILDE